MYGVCVGKSDTISSDKNMGILTILKLVLTDNSNDRLESLN
jgi:hypothetical protein